MRGLYNQVADELDFHGLAIPPLHKLELFKAPPDMACPEDSLNEHEVADLLKAFDVAKAEKFESWTKPVDKWLPPPSVVEDLVHIIILDNSRTTTLCSPNLTLYSIIHL